MAGLTLAAYLLPAGIGDASLAGLPPEAGLYACLFSGLVFWLFCSSRHTVITVTSALSLLIGASVGELSGGDPARHAALAACAGAHGRRRLRSRPGWCAPATAVSFFSETVLVGFKAGLALYLASTQLPKLFGFSGIARRLLGARGLFPPASRRDTHATSLLLGVAALAVLFAGKLWLKNRPVALLRRGRRHPRRADARSRQPRRRAAGRRPAGPADAGTAGGRPRGPQRAAAAGARLLRARRRSRRRPSDGCSRRSTATASTRTRRFLALGAANLAAGLGRGFPVSGGMSQSLVNESAGARTPLSGLVAALFTLCRRALRLRACCATCRSRCWRRSCWRR